MGYGMSVICRNCGNEETYLLGIGMRYFSLEAVLDTVVPRKRRDHIREILKTCELPITEYEHKLYTCPKCNTLHGRFYIDISDKGIPLYESQFRCGKCRTKLVDAEGDVIRYNCARCGEKSLQLGAEMMWD